MDNNKKKIEEVECLHDKCKECNGTGKRKDGKTCIHVISCLCKKCIPIFG